MKCEQRAHAVLCRSDNDARDLAANLNESTSAALREFVRHKWQRQNYRLMVKKTLGVDATVCKRKTLLSAGQNYKPPVERSRSAPRLHSIDECLGEEEEAMLEETRTDLSRAMTAFNKLNLVSDIFEEDEYDIDGDSLGDSIETNSETTSDDFECGNSIDDLGDNEGVQFYLTNSSDFLTEEDDLSISGESGFSECDSEHNGIRTTLFLEEDMGEMDPETTKMWRSESVVSRQSSDTLKDVTFDSQDQMLSPSAIYF